MFRFNDRKDEQKRQQKELYKNIKMEEKIKFKDLMSIMFAQYLIILPLAFIIMVGVIFAIKLLLRFWGA